MGLGRPRGLLTDVGR